MIDHRKNELVIVEGLKAYLTTDERPCEVVRQNQVADTPAYPYVSYTVTTPASEDKGTYSEAEDGTLYKSVLQTWSFTAQSDDQEEAMAIAFRVYDYFSAVGVTYLADNKITVRRVRDITSRDSVISMQYEYRNGLDVTFGLLYLITPENRNNPDLIETSKIMEV